MANPVVVMASLRVSQTAWRGELVRLAKLVGRRRADQAVLRYENGTLRVKAGGAECALPAEGRWPGEARVSWSWLYALIKVPPAQDPISISVQEGHIRIAGSSLRCEWQRFGAAALEVPMDASLLDLLRLGLVHSADELKSGGLENAVANAKRERKALVKRACAALAPLGVSMEDLDRLVDLRIQR